MLVFWWGWMGSALDFARLSTGKAQESYRGTGDVALQPETRAAGCDPPCIELGIARMT